WGHKVTPIGESSSSCTITLNYESSSSSDANEHELGIVKAITNMLKRTTLCHSSLELVFAKPCLAIKMIFLKSVSNKQPYTYMYTTLFYQLSIHYPLSTFKCELHPNSLTFVKAFQILYHYLHMIPTTPKLLHFY
ncbi:hypothetical protein CR513_56975, partial [Mucuna pruriens]